VKFNFKDTFDKIKESIPKKEKKETPPASNEAEDGRNEAKERLTKEKILDNVGKIGDFFNPEPQMERVLRHEDFNGAGDTYYANVSAFYKVAERLLWLILVVFMVISLVTNYKEITYDNFFYLLKDFSTAADSEVPSYQVLSYDSDSRQTFALYRGGLVSASPSAVSVFTAGGRRTLKSNTEYYSPNIVCSDRYVLVYDSASAAFSVYNSFSKVYNERLESPITDACFGSDGSFAVATKNEDSQSVIYLYGKDIKLRGDISESKYIFDMAIGENGERFCTLTYQAGNGKGMTTLNLYSIKSSESSGKLESIDIDGEFPIGCAYLDNGRIAVLTNLAIRIYDKDLDEREKHTFYGSNIRAFKTSADGISVVVSSDAEKKIIAYDEKGEFAYEDDLGENVSAIEQCDGYLFLRTASGVIRIDMNNNEREFLPSESGKMLIYGNDTAMVCGEAKAEYLVFGKDR
jgi:hypothetical protein